MSAPPPAATAAAGSDDDSRPSVHRWEIVGLLWFAYFLNQADRQIFGVTLPLIRADFGLSDTQMGLVATTFTVVFGLMVPLAGLLGDMFRRDWIVILSLFVFSAGTLLTGLASGFVLLLLFRGLATGVGEALYAPAANALVAEHHGRTRGRALAIHQTANYTGVVLGSLFAGWVADEHGWRAAFLLFGAAGLFWALIILWRSRRFAQRRAPASAGGAAARPASRALIGEALRTVVTTPALLAQLIGFSGLVFMLTGYLTWMPTILAERFGLSLAEAGFQSVVWHHLLGYAGLLLAGATGDRLILRFRRARLFIMAGSMLACAPFILLSATADNEIAVYLALAAFGFFRGTYDANLFAAIYDAVEDRLRSTVTGVIVAAAYLVGALSPLIMGMLKDAHGLEAALKLIAAAPLVAGLLFLAIISLGTRREPAI